MSTTATRPALSQKSELRQSGEKALFQSASQLGTFLRGEGLSRKEAAYHSALALHFTMQKKARCLVISVAIRQVASHEATVERLRQRSEVLIPVSSRTWRYDGARVALLFTSKEAKRHEVGYVRCRWAQGLLRAGYPAYLDVSDEAQLVIAFKPSNE